MRRSRQGLVLVAAMLARLVVACGYDASDDPRFAPTAQAVVRQTVCTTDADGARLVYATIGAQISHATYSCDEDTSVGSCQPGKNDPDAPCSYVNKDFGPHWGEATRDADEDVTAIATSAETRGDTGEARRIVAVLPNGARCVTFDASIRVDDDGNMQHTSVDACCTPDGG